jgi:chorismate mutase / prephenate dehydrogenase
MDLEEIRKKISNLDDQIIDLIARRETIVNEVSQYKIQEGIPIRDFTREKKVINRAREKADQLNLNADMIESVMLLLIESSLSKQEKIRVTSKNIGRDRRALVIGGKGKMGIWMDEFLTSQGYEVFISDSNAPNEKNESIDWMQGSLDYDIVVVATPLSKTGGILLELAKRKPRGLVIDIASLKSPLRKGLKELQKAGCKVISIHPMFGPDTRLLAHKHLVLIDLGDAGALAEVTELFSSTMVDMVVMSLDEHDKVMGYILGLSHIINIAFMDALVNSGEHLESLRNISSTTFNAQLNVAARVTQDNPDLYFEIQALNEFGRHPVNEMVASLNSICKLIDEDKKESFINIMLKGRAYIKNKVVP